MKTKALIIGVGFLAGLLTIGMSDYNTHLIAGVKVELLLCIGSILGALILSLFLKERPSEVALQVYLGIMVSALARIIYDTTFIDSTSHNLLPFELIYYTVFSLPFTFAGAYLAHIAKLLKKK